MSIADNKAAVARAFERFNQGDMAGYLQLFGPTVVMHGLTPAPLVGRPAVQAFYEAIGAGFSQASLACDDLVAEADRVVVRFTMSGRHTGVFMQVPPSGRQVSAAGITILRFEGPECVERWSSFDFMGLMIQIGALPAPA